MKKQARRRSRRSLRNTGARPVVLHCSHPGCKRTWDFFSSRSPYAEKSITPEMTEWLNDGGALVMSRDDGWGVAFDNKSICDVHNRRLGGFESYTVKCGHPRCHETFRHSFYQPLSDAEGASYSASIEAISQGGWGMAAGKSLRCPAHARIEKSVIIRDAIAKTQPSSDQVFFESGAHIGVPSEYFSTVRSMRGKRVKITITLDE